MSTAPTIICKRCGTETPTWTGTCSHCGGTEAVSVAPPPETMLGRVVNGRFKLKRKIGQGGMGTVYEADDLKLGMRSAVKFLNPELSQNVELARRFLTEARVYARINHPGAVTLHDFGQEPDGTLYIAMEFVEGHNLKELLDERRRLPLGEAIAIVLQVANVLEHTHEKGVVHRDLKPENVMVQQGLHGVHVKVLDFGVARRIYDGATRLTVQGAMAGTPRYMAPEQVRAEDVDGRIDIYALGLLTWELITGRPAMDAPDIQGMIRQQLEGALDALGSVDPALHHPQLDAVLERATHKDRQQRYQTMAEFAAALSAAAKSPTVLMPAPAPVVPAAPTAPTYLAKATPIPLVTPATEAATVPLVAPRRWPRWLALALAVALLGGTLGWYRRSQGLALPGAAPACQGEDLYTPELRDLSTQELERRALAVPIMRPSDARKQLDSMQAMLQSYAADKRDCFYRLSLLATLTSTQTVLRTTPALWGHTRDVGRLRSLLMEMPLKGKWSPAQRASVIEQIEKLFIANLAAKDEGDRDFWRRQYYGIELLCEVTDEGLAELHTQRPDSCLNLKP